MLTRNLKANLLSALGSGRMATLREVAAYGAASACPPNLTYYHQTTGFFKENQMDIAHLVEVLSEGQGSDPLGFVKSLSGCEHLSWREVAITLYCSQGEPVHEVANTLVWLALEELAYEYATPSSQCG